MGSDPTRLLAGVVTGMLIFFHINLLSFIFERVPIESSALSRRVIRKNVTQKSFLI